MQILKKHQKGKMTLFVNTIVLTALVKMSVFLHFSFFLFLQVPFLDVFDWFPKNQKIPKKQSKQNKKQEQKEDKRCKSKNKWNIMILNKARQQAEQQKPKNSLKEESKQSKKEKQ